MEQRREKPRDLRRHLIQAAFFALTNGYAQGFATGRIYSGENKSLCVPGLNCYSCPGAYFACPIGSLQAVLNSRNFKVSCYVFGFLMMTGALLGRLVCAFLCPFGLVQDLIYHIPFPRKRKNMPGHSRLRWLRWLFLFVFVLALPSLVRNAAGIGKPWFCEYVCPSGTLLAGIPLVALTPQLQASIGWRFWLKCSILAAVLALSLKYYRPFCKYVCPLGALYGACNPISFYRFRVDQEKCVRCGSCQAACRMDIRVFEHPNSPDCIRCGDCLRACPTHALTSTWQDLQQRTVRDLPDPSAASAEPASALRTAIGFVLAALGLVMLAGFGLLTALTFAGVFLGQADSYTLVGLLSLYGSAFMDTVIGYILMKAGALILHGRGRSFFALRAVRMLVPAAALLIITRILAQFNANAFSALAAGILWWSLPIVQLILALSCRAGKKPAEEGSD